MPAAARRTLAVLLVALLAPVATTGALEARPTGTADDEAAFVSRINADRRAAGLPAYATAGDLVTVARRHAQRMADRGEHYHNPNLASEVSGWRLVGENVGQGPDVAGLHQAFMSSPSHRANILRREFTQVGVGVVRSASGRIFVVEVFRQPATAAAAPAPAPAPAPAAAPSPPPPPTTTTLPPTTTTAPPAPTTTVPPPTTTTVPAAAPTSDTLSAAGVLASQPVVARVELPAAGEPSSPSGTAAVVAAGLILAMLAAHAGRFRHVRHP